MRTKVDSIGVLTLLWLLDSFVSRPAEGSALRHLTDADVGSWRQLAGLQITPDGNWLAYSLMPYSYQSGISSPLLRRALTGEGEVVVVVRRTDNDDEKRYSAGEASLGAGARGALKMSASGRWIAFPVAPSLKDSHRLKQQGQSVQLGVAVIDMSSGVRRDFTGIRAFSFVGPEGSWLLLEHYPRETTDSKFELTLERLDRHEVHALSDVTLYSINKTGTQLVWSGSEGLKARDLMSGHSRVLEATAERAYRSLTWSDSGNALTLLRGNGLNTALVILTNLNRKTAGKTVLMPRILTGFPAGYQFSAPMKWRDDEGGVFFSIYPSPQKVEAKEAVPNLVLWHSADNLTPGERKYETDPMSDWCFVPLGSKRFIRLSDPALQQVEPHGRGRYALGYDTRSYGPISRALEGEGRSLPRDYYLIDLSTGNRKLIIKALYVVVRASLSVPPQLSPDGSIVLYQNNNGDYVGYEVQTGRSRNLTVDLPTKFYYDENRPNTHRQPRDISPAALQGWSADGTSVFLSDYYDIWAIPLSGGQAINLTTNGRRNHITYSFYSIISFPPKPSRLNLNETLYFTARNQTTGAEGLARRLPGQASLEVLRWNEGNTAYLKASRSNRYFMAPESASTCRDIYALSEKWEVAKRLTDSNPQQQEYQWPAGVKYLTYKTSHGDTQHAFLYLPAGFEPGRSYPAIVHIYLEGGAGFSYRPFDVDNYPWLQRGYAVLMPDIRPRLNEAGRAAVEGVTAAVNAAVATGAVDRNRLGLEGHSYGGYETFFVVSQTNLFRAAAPYAGMTNLWSNYGAIYADRWPNSLMMESGQPFLSGPWWEAWDAYLGNSPLYFARNIKTPLLILHGDQDDSVPFSQALEMFNTLRRMKNKQVVLLQYVGEQHSFESESSLLDAELRRLEFFDHFLNGASAPTWWSRGISLYNGQVSPSGGLP